MRHYHTDHPGTPERTVTFQYDTRGLLIAYDDGQISAAYSYDNLGRKTSETVNYPGHTHSHQQTWHANGRQASLTAPHGTTYSFSWDSADRLQAIMIPGEGAVQYTDYQWHHPTTVRFPGGSTRTQSFDGLGRHQSIQLKSPSEHTLMDYEYTWDDTGNITEKVTEHGDYQYAYDDIDRLTEADYPRFSAEEWTYDPLGNRMTDTKTGEAEWQYNQNNELLSSIDHSYEYDANGSLIAEYHPDGSVFRTHEYNAETRLTAIRDGQGNLIAEYRYDPFGRRIQKTTYSPPGQNPETTWYLYSDQGLMAELDGEGTQTDFYLFPPDGLWSTDPILRRSGASYYYYQTDHLGTPQQLIDRLGNVVHSREMKAFGETTETGIEDRLRFPGQLHSQETGLHYNYFRDYAPGVGRYVSRDPIGLYAGYNIYNYVESRPVKLYDPMGLMAEGCAYSPPPHQCHFRKQGSPQYVPTSRTRVRHIDRSSDDICVPFIPNFRIRYRGRTSDFPPDDNPILICWVRYTETRYREREYKVLHDGVLVCDQENCSDPTITFGRRQTGCEWLDDGEFVTTRRCFVTDSMHGRSECRKLF